LPGRDVAVCVANVVMQQTPRRRVRRRPCEGGRAINSESYAQYIHLRHLELCTQHSILSIGILISGREPKRRTSRVRRDAALLFALQPSQTEPTRMRRCDAANAPMLYSGQPALQSAAGAPHSYRGSQCSWEPVANCDPLLEVANCDFKFAYPAYCTPASGLIFQSGTSSSQSRLAALLRCHSELVEESLLFVGGNDKDPSTSSG
jgi:hypothetical protein